MISFGISVPNFGPFADPLLFGKIAEEAEKAGWDGVFPWDDLYAEGEPVGDVTVTLAVIALRTSRIRFGPMITPLPRRRPAKLAREMTSLDQISGGRVLFGAGIGAVVEEYRDMGEENDPRIRGNMLDDGLDLLAKLWSGEPVDHAGPDHHYQVRIEAPAGSRQLASFQPTPVQQPRIPIWIAAMAQNKRPLRRAAKWDGLYYLPDDDRALTTGPTLEELKWAVDYARQHRDTDAPWDIVTGGITSVDPASSDGERIAEMVQGAGLTWWVEQINPWAIPGNAGEGEWNIEAMFERVRSGPPRLPSQAHIGHDLRSGATV